MNLGVSFAPTNQAPGPNQSQPNTANPVQDAIRILSFRLPTVLGASAATPMQNLGAPSIFGSQLGSSIIQQFLKSLSMPSAGGQTPSPYASLFGGQAVPQGSGSLTPSITLGTGGGIVANPSGPSAQPSPQGTGMAGGGSQLPQMPNVFGGGPRQA